MDAKEKKEKLPRLRVEPYLKYPKSVGIETLRLCNGHCVFCPYERLGDKGTRLPTETVYRLLDELREIPCSFALNLTRVNEPLLDERIPDFYQYAAEILPQNVYFILFTNASLLDARHRRWILRMPRLTAFLSLNEFEPDAYNKMMGLDFTRTWSNLRALHSDFNGNTAGGGGSPFKVSRVGDGSERDQEFLLHVKEWFPKFSGWIWPQFSWLDKNAAEPAPESACMEYYTLRVLANGKVAWCCIDGDGRYAVGDVNTRGLLEIYRDSPLACGRPRFLPRKEMPAPCVNCNNGCQAEMRLPG